jgi:integrase
LTARPISPSGERATKDTPGAVRTESRAAKWYGRYTDATGKQRREPLSESKEIARRMRAVRAGKAQLNADGIDADPFAGHRARPLVEHLADYERFLLAKGDTKAHVAKTGSRIRTILEGCHFEKLDDLAAAAVVEFIASLRQAPGRPRVPLDPTQEWYTKAEMVAVLGIHPASVSRPLRRDGLPGQGEGKARRYPRATVETLQERLCEGTGVATCNHYLGAIKSFARWLARERRIPANPLSHLSGRNSDVDVRRPRRALRGEVFDRFIEATGAGRTLRGLTGADRLVLYTLAAQTGFRANELASLTPASFDFEARPPTVTVEAAYSKHRR